MASEYDYDDGSGGYDYDDGDPYDYDDGYVSDGNGDEDYGLDFVGNDENLSEDIASNQGNPGDCRDPNHDYDDDDDEDDDVVDSDSDDSEVIAFDSRYDLGDISQQMEKVHLKCDGASNGNSGRASTGATLKYENGIMIAREYEVLGKDMNNAAEYRALNPGTRATLDMGYKYGNDTVITRVHEGLGKNTKNVAEYSALNPGTRATLDMGYDRILLNGDSQLVTPHQGADHGESYDYHAENSTKQSEKVYLEFDGASKGNPGRAGAGALLKSEDGTVITRVREGLGEGTNNDAEYRSLIQGLKTALDMRYDRIHAKGDSQLVVNQGTLKEEVRGVGFVTLGVPLGFHLLKKKGNSWPWIYFSNTVKGEWQTRNDKMAKYRDEARKLSYQFKEFEISHFPRRYNSDADAEAQKAVNLPAGQVQKEDNWHYIRN